MQTPAVVLAHATSLCKEVWRPVVAGCVILREKKSPYIVLVFRTVVLW